MSFGWITTGIATLVLGVALPAHLAQHSPHAHGTQAHQSAMAELQLTSDQMDAVHRIVLDLHIGMFKLHGDPSLSDEQRAQAAKDLKAKAETGLAKVLTSEQFAKFKSMHGLEHPMGFDVDHLHQIFAKLQLTHAQHGAIFGIVGETLTSLRQLLDDKSVTPDQRQAKIGALHEAAMKRMQEVLTPAQMETLHQLMQNHGGGSSH